MPRYSQQKNKALYIMQILGELSDEEHPLSSYDIIDELKELDIPAERKSVYSDIAHLSDFGLDIVPTRVPKRGWFLGERDFQLTEVRLLMDAVQSASFITPKKTKELIEKLLRKVSRYQAQELEKSISTDARVKSTNEEVYYTLDVIQRAIAKNSKIKFMYFRREVDEGRVARNKGKPFSVSPYALIWRNGQYYLVCNISWFDTLTHFRLDRMEDVIIYDKPIRSFEEVSEAERRNP